MSSWRLDADPEQLREGRWKQLPMPQMSGMSGPEGYVAHANLVEAINTALTLGLPLLVTGEPGCGKTELGDYIAWKLGLSNGKPKGSALRVDINSDSLARDLFYSFDVVARLHAANNQGGVAPVNFIRYHGLGEAIIRAADPNRRESLLPPGFEHRERRRSVVLIDEIDKAPRDVPNNLLRALEDASFSIPEIGHALIKADDEFRPIVVITSNSEKFLPDAFLRRCVYYHLPPLEPETLKTIAVQRLGDVPRDGGLVSDSVNLLMHLRNHKRMDKPPSTSELLNFLLAMQNRKCDMSTTLSNIDYKLWSSLAKITLFKTRNDQTLADQYLDSYGKG